MARRGVMTALQAALAGIGGAAGGLVQQEELKRRRQIEDEERKQRQAALEAGLQAGIRSEQRDILKLGGTRIAGMGEQVAGPVPSAIPLSGVGNAFAAAEAAGGPATSRGALRQTVGESSFMLPGAAETRAQTLQAALEQARAERGVTREFGEEDFQATNKRNFETFRALGGRGEYKPDIVYSKMIENRQDELQAGRQRSLLEAREGAKAAAGAGKPGASGAPGERGPLPSVLEAINFIDSLSTDDIKKLSGWGVANATAAPTTMASGTQGFLGAALGPVVSGMQYSAASEADREYAEYASMISRQVARLNEKGILSNQDVNDYKTQTAFISRESNEGKLRKAARLKAWAEWIANVDTDPEAIAKPLPEESPERRQLRNAPMRAGAAAVQPTGANVEERRRLWDEAVEKYGLQFVTSRVGERP